LMRCFGEMFQSFMRCFGEMFQSLLRCFGEMFQCLLRCFGEMFQSFMRCFGEMFQSLLRCFGEMFQCLLRCFSEMFQSLLRCFGEMFQSMIYYTVRSTKLEAWLENESIRDSLRPTLDKNYVDLDPTFAGSVDEDYDHRLSGVSKNSFTNIYVDWIQHCSAHRDQVSPGASIVFD